MIAVRFARRALRELDRIETWCRANRPASWPLFVSELAQAIRLLRVAPELGPEYQAARTHGVRRLLLERTQFYAYYRYHPQKALVVILSVWSTRRRRPPALP
ncbi:type II toxin-antitoxin system RelE/ParE family toxin [Sorangium sp. So ce119]|uniref:type II toxin-antitoxin system RelE/ParE family toxin n=1 Tax=Sorangium sp. So ce119 TaxID=3133279 RepID=UPI003F605260